MRCQQGVDRGLVTSYTDHAAGRLTNGTPGLVAGWAGSARVAQQRRYLSSGDDGPRPRRRRPGLRSPSAKDVEGNSTSSISQKARFFSSSSWRRSTSVLTNPRQDDEGQDMLVEITPRAAKVPFGLWPCGALVELTCPVRLQASPRDHATRGRPVLDAPNTSHVRRLSWVPVSHVVDELQTRVFKRGGAITAVNFVTSFINVQATRRLAAHRLTNTNRTRRTATTTRRRPGPGRHHLPGHRRHRGQGHHGRTQPRTAQGEQSRFHDRAHRQPVSHRRQSQGSE